MSSIEWETTLGYAEDASSSSRKPILFDYFDPECIGCQQMDELVGGGGVQGHDLVQPIRILLGKSPGECAAPVMTHQGKSRRARQVAR